MLSISEREGMWWSTRGGAGVYIPSYRNNSRAAGSISSFPHCSHCGQRAPVEKALSHGYWSEARLNILAREGAEKLEQQCDLGSAYHRVVRLLYDGHCGRWNPSFDNKLYS